MSLYWRFSVLNKACNFFVFELSINIRLWPFFCAFIVQPIEILSMWTVKATFYFHVFSTSKPALKVNPLSSVHVGSFCQSSGCWATKALRISLLQCSFPFMSSSTLRNILTYLFLWHIRMFTLIFVLRFRRVWFRISNVGACLILPQHQPFVLQPSSILLLPCKLYLDTMNG